MQNNILQNTPEWQAAKQKTIGGSEVFSLVHHYCAKELQDMGFSLAKERPFRTVQEMFLKVAFDAKLSPIDPMHSEFGNGMESYVSCRLQQELPQLLIERTKDFIINPELHPLAACSPDGYLDFIETKDLVQISDFDKTCLIDRLCGKGMLELKTANYFANFDQGGSRLQYLFQLQYNMMVAGLKWGCLAVLLPKEKKFDEPFFKGQILERLKWTEGKPYFKEGHEDNVNNFYDLQYYIYPQLPVFQAMITKALNAFQADLDAYASGNEKAFPRATEDLVGLQREKQLWGQLWPDHFGNKQLEEEDELNALLNERLAAQEQKMFAEQAFDSITNEIYQKIKARGFDKFCEIKGTENRLLFIKNGQIRFYRINNKEQQ